MEDGKLIGNNEGFILGRLMVVGRCEQHCHPTSV
jgi:hypothetical protein